MSHLALARLAALAEARTSWVCIVPGEGTVTFVSAADAARHGVTRANDRAGMAFFNNFGEICSVPD